MNLLATDLVDTSPYHPGGTVGDAEHFVFNWVMLASIVLGTFTALLLLYSMFRFRRKHDDEEPRQFHGNTRLEIFWTVVPLVVFLSLFGLTFSQMGFINDAPASASVMNVTVVGVQYSWSFDYNGEKRSNGNDVTSATTLYVPADTPINLQVVSSDVPCVTHPMPLPGDLPDEIQREAALQAALSSGTSLADAISNQGCGVIHSLYLPQLSGQVNAVPGQTNHMWFTARQGHYYGQCTELCGIGHAGMLVEVVAMPQAQFQQWLTQQLSK
ncbi:MAG: cytochrome c oxidase subunit II [Candidatus Dormibacteria bacterium]